jgi:hypothetical protein
MRYLNLRYGGKGFVLSLDALIGALLAFSMFSYLLFYPLANEAIMEKLYLTKQGSDAMIVIDYNEKIDTLNESEITQELENLLNSSEMKLNITYSDSELESKTNLVFGNQPRGFAGSGKRFFVVSNETDITFFGVVSYNIWKK